MIKPLAHNPGIETAESDEGRTEAELVETLLGISQMTLKDERETLRAAHAKSHGILKATLTVLPNLGASYA